MRRFFKFYLFRKLFLAFITLNIISVIVVGLLLYVDFTHTLKGSDKNNSIRSLEQLNDLLTDMYDGFCEDAYGVLSLRESGSFMRRREIDRIEEYRLQQHLKVLVTANSQLNDLGVVNLLTDRYLSARKVYFGISWLKELPGMQKSNQVKLIWNGDGDGTYESWKGLNLVYVPGGDMEKGIVTGNVSKETLEGFLERCLFNKEQYLLLFDDDGNLLGDREWIKIDDLSPLVEQIKNHKTGQMEIVLKEETCLVTFAKSGIEGVNLVSIFPRTVLNESVHHIIWLYGICIIGLSAVYLILSVYLSRMIYMPVQKLLKHWGTSEGETQQKINELEDIHRTLLMYDDIVRRSQIEHYLENPQEDLKFSREIYDKTLREIGGKKYYRVVLFALDDRDKLIRSPEMENLLNRIMKEEIEELCILERCIRKSQSVLLNVIGADERPVGQELLLGFKGIQAMLYQHIGINISVSCGIVVESLAQLRESYENAEYGLSQRLHLGKNVIFDGELHEKKKRTDRYPDKAAKQVVSGILQSDKEKMETALEYFVQTLAVSDGEGIIKGALRLTTEMKERLKETGITPAWKDQEVEERLRNCVVISDLKMVLGEICMSAWEMSGGSGDETDYKEACIQSINQYIQENYSNPMLSVEILASRVGMSPGYFGKVFYQYNKKNCTDYILEVRMKAAVGKLLDTNERVKDISEAVGIYNVNYFYSLFKKQYGKTPNQFRKEKRTYE